MSAAIVSCGEFTIRRLVQMRAQSLGASDAMRHAATRIAIDHWRKGRSGTFGITVAHGYMRDCLRGAQPEQPAC